MTADPDLLTVVLSPPPTPNGPLHVGHLAGPYVAADVAARAARRRGEDVLTVCGLDDNQNYVVAGARQLEEPADRFRDRNARLVRDVFAGMGIHHDVFVEPHADERYRAVVSRFLHELEAAGRVRVEDWTALACQDCGCTLHHAYVVGRCSGCGAPGGGGTCESCGRFATAGDLDAPRCARCGGAPRALAVRGPVLHLEDHREVLAEAWSVAAIPAEVRAIAGRYLAHGLPAVPLTYPTDWGIEVVGGQRLDVWAEMGLGYLALIGGRCDPSARSLDEHVAAWRAVGKVWSFLGIDNAFYYLALFPALFAAAGVAPSTLGGLVVNHFYRLGGRKFSTSRGHAVWAHELLDRTDPGSLRLYLCWDRPAPYDSDFDLVRFQEFARSWRAAGAAGRYLDPQADALRAEHALRLEHFDAALAARCLLAAIDRHEGDPRAPALLGLLTGAAAVGLSPAPGVADARV